MPCASCGKPCALPRCWGKAANRRAGRCCACATAGRSRSAAPPPRSPRFRSWSPCTCSRCTPPPARRSRSFSPPSPRARGCGKRCAAYPPRARSIPSPWTRRPTTFWKTACPNSPRWPLLLLLWRRGFRPSRCSGPDRERSRQRLALICRLHRRPLPLPHPSSAGPNPHPGPHQRRRSLPLPSPQPEQDGRHPPDRAPQAGRRGSRQPGRPPVERAGGKKMRVCAAEASLVPRRVRGRLSCPGAAQTGPMSNRAPHRRMLAPQKDRRRLAEPGPIDPAGGVEQNENDPHPGPCREGSRAPLLGLRAPAAAAILRSAPRRVAGSGPPLVPRASPLHHSGRARHKASEDPRIAGGQDRRQLALKAVRRLPIGRNKRALAKRAAGPLRKVAGPAAPGQPDSTNPDSTNPGLTNPGLINQGSPSRDGRSRGQPGPPHPGRLPRRVPVPNPEPITTGRVLPAMPGRGKAWGERRGKRTQRSRSAAALRPRVQTSQVRAG